VLAALMKVLATVPFLVLGHAKCSFTQLKVNMNDIFLSKGFSHERKQSIPAQARIRVKFKSGGICTADYTVGSTLLLGALDKARNHRVYQFIPARVIQPRCSSECDLNHSLSRPLAASKPFTRFT
jgi:hypothetical protein